MKTHELKTWPGAFDAVVAGTKKYEIRRMDRAFTVGDELWLREYDASDGYSGREVHVVVTYMSQPGAWGLPNNLCVMSIEVKP